MQAFVKAFSPLDSTSNGYYPFDFNINGSYSDTVLLYYFVPDCDRVFRIRIIAHYGATGLLFDSRYFHSNSCPTPVEEVEINIRPIVSFWVYDKFGRLVLQRNHSLDSNLKNEGIPCGIYFLQTFDGKKFQTEEVLLH